MSGCEFDRLLEKLLLSKKLTLASLQRALRYDGPSRRARICTTRSSSHFISAFAASLSFSSSLPRPLTNAAAFLVCVVKQTIVSCQRRVAMERHMGPTFSDLVPPFDASIILNFECINEYYYGVGLNCHLS